MMILLMMCDAGWDMCLMIELTFYDVGCDMCDDLDVVDVSFMMMRR